MSIKISRGIKICLMLTVMLCILSITSLAYEPYISPGELKIKTIKFYDSDGKILDSLVPGEVTVSTTAKSFLRDNNATLIVCVYKDNEMVEFGTSETLSFVFGKPGPLSATVTVPEGADTLTAFVWEDSGSLFPYAHSAVIFSNDADVENIILDGVPVENFNKDTKSYTVYLNPGYMTYPEIVVETSDSSATVEITNTPFTDDAPTTVINVKNGNSEENYTVSYIKEAPAVFDMKINTDNIKNTTGVDISEANCKITTDILRDPALDTATRVWNNRPDCIYNEFPEFLLGATAVQLTRNLAIELPANYDYASYGDMMEFKVDRSCDIYVHIDNPTGFPWLSANGFLPSDVKVKRWNSEISMYKKTVYVDPGESATVSLGYIKGGTTEPTILVKFLDELPEKELIENAKLYKATDDSFITNVTVLKDVKQYGFVNGTLEGTALYAESNLEGAVKPFTASWRNYYLHISEMLEGSDYLKLGYTWADVTGSGSVPYYCTFELTKSATVYAHLWNFAANKDKLYDANPWLSGYEWINEGGDFEVGYIKDGVLSTKSYGFKKTYTIDPGETVTITVGPFIHPTNPTDQYTHPFVFVKAE